MYSVLIADDEPTIRTGLSEFIRWSDFGCRLAGVAGDGLEALEMLQSDPPDILISDIKMPKLDGLELLKFARREYPRVRFIIISGYDEFAFAQTALNNAACAYLLKPIVLEELADRVREVIAQIERQNELDSLALSVSERQALAEHAASAIYGKIISNALTEEDSFNFSRLIQEIERSTHVVLTVQLRDFDVLAGSCTPAQLSEALAAFGSLGALCEAQSEVAAVASASGTLSVVLSAPQREDVARAADRALRLLTDWSDQNPNHPIQVGVGGPSPALSGLAMSNLESVKCIHCGYLFGDERVIRYSSINALMLEPLGSDFLGALPDLLLAGKSSVAREGLRAYLDANRRALEHRDFSSVKRLLYRLTEFIRQFDLVHAMPDHQRQFERICKQQSANELRASLLDVVRTLCEACSAYKSSVDTLVQRVKRYVDENYADSSLTLNSIANSIGFNASYLSSAFGKGNDLSLSSYITEKRIKKACDLLVFSDYKVFSIAQAVGYQNQTYFSTRFKEITGCSPSQYREQYRRNSRAGAAR